MSVVRDVKTRWNSTYDMCSRALRVKSFIDEWLNIEIANKHGARATGQRIDGSADIDFRDLRRLRLDSTEWEHLFKLTKMLQKFKEATNFLSQQQGPQIQHIWHMYNRLFDFMDDMTKELDDSVDEDSGEQHDDNEWPTIVLNAANKGREKLSKYYSKTDASRGYLFNCATVLDPTQKLSVYEVRLSQLFITHKY